MQSQVAIAQEYMERKQYKKAAPYADAAAETAQPGNACASECHEALHDWDVSEKLIQDTAEHYTEQQCDWYFWCRRTNHGNVDAAQQLAAQRIKALALRGAPQEFRELGTYYLLAGETAQATTVFQRPINKGAIRSTGCAGCCCWTKRATASRATRSPESCPRRGPTAQQKDDPLDHRVDQMAGRRLRGSRCRAIEG